jgi:dihydrofolate reductase
VSTVYVDMSVSLDGFVAASNRTADEPLGKGGELLHEWSYSGKDPRNSEIIEETVDALGAMITGRGNYEDSLRWWGPNGPTGESRLPLFVITHSPPADAASDTVYTFVAGLDEAVQRAKQAAAGKNVAVSGADVSKQLIRAGHVDELSIHVVPVLFGGGLPLYDLGGDHVQLELIRVIDTAEVTHLRYRVVR